MSEYVYFAQGAAGGPIKIGVSANPKNRVQAISSSSATPVDLIVAVPGGRAMEAVLHRLFASGRLGGEWFADDTPGLAEVVEMFLLLGVTTIRSLREASGKHRRNVAADLGLSEQHLERLESGRVPLRRVVALAFADYYGVPLEGIEGVKAQKVAA